MKRNSGHQRCAFRSAIQIPYHSDDDTGGAAVIAAFRSVLAGLCAGIVVSPQDSLSQSTIGDVEALKARLSDRAPIPLPQFRHDEAAIVVDGHLDEEAWNLQRLNEKLWVISPDTLSVAPYDTVLRMFYTERGVYFSFELEQPADTIVEKDTTRDNDIGSRDQVHLSLDTSGTGRYGYWMSLALGDNLADGTLLPERQYNSEWDGAWHGATQRTASGWTAEAFVPWSQLSMPRAENRRLMGVYVSRQVAHLNEKWAWPGLPKTQSQFMSILPKLALSDVDPRQQWSLFPFVSARHDRIDSVTQYKVGTDFFWRPSSNFQLTATVNPDFGTVEADDVVVNLTADETFFPEKRLFFLEGQDVFTATPRAVSKSQRFTVINTKRIGSRPPIPDLPAGAAVPLRQALRPSDMLWAGKATGQTGPLRFGLLAAFEDQTNFDVGSGHLIQDGRDFGALRLLYEDDHAAGYRGLGWISTLVNLDDAEAAVHAVDFHYLSRSGRWGVDGQLLSSDRTDSGRGYGAYADITYTVRQGLKHTLELTAFDDALDVNDLGFQRRNDVREAWYRMQWSRSGLTRIRNFTVSPFLRYEVNGDGYRTNSAIASEFVFKLNNLDDIKILVAHFPERYDDRNSFGNGTFDVASRQQGSFLYRTDKARPLSVFGKVGFQGEFVGGETYEMSAGLTWQPASYLNIEFSAARLDRNGWLLHQEDRHFTAFDAIQWQALLRANYFLSSKQHFSLAFQWIGVQAREDAFYTLEEDGTALIPGPKPPGPADDFSLSQLSFQLRYRWQMAPLSDLFVVYTKGDVFRGALRSYSDLLQASWNDPLTEQVVIKLRQRFGS